MTLTQTTRSGHGRDDAQRGAAAAGSDVRLDHGSYDTHQPYVEAASTPPQARADSVPKSSPPAGAPFPESASGQSAADAHMRYAAVETTLPADHSALDAQAAPVGGGTLPGGARVRTTPIAPPPLSEQTGNGSRATKLSATPKVRTSLADPFPPFLPADQSRHDAHTSDVGGEPTWNGSEATTVRTTPMGQTSLADPFLALAANVLDDAESTRIANENRFRQLIRGGNDDPRLKARNKDGTLKYATIDDLPPDKDGEERGFGLDESHPDVARLAAIVDMLGKVEHQAALNLAKMLRQHPLGAWMLAQKGIGQKQGARLLAVVGDPYLGPDGHPRTVSQLWAYCGHGDPARRKFKGMTQADLFTLGNPVAKSRLWLIACACLKAQGPYSETYYKRKVATVGREHARECVRCGPSGHPALLDSPWSDAHRHADALRVTGKAILRDLWCEAKRLHETTTDPGAPSMAPGRPAASSPGVTGAAGSGAAS